VKKDIVIAVVAVVIVAALAFGLAALRPSSPATPSQPHEASESAGVKEGTVVMSVNGEPITDREFNLFILSAPEEARPFYGTPAGRRALADELVKLKVLEQEAKRLGVTDDPEVKSQIAMAVSQITAGRALEKLADAKSEERIRAEYEKEKANAVALRHILVAYQGGQVPAREGAQPLSESAAMQKAKSIEAKLRAGADFAQTARAESDDTQSGAQGGSLGPARPDLLPPDIAGVVTKLKPGEMSAPVKTQFGIHIFKVEQPSLEDLRPALRQKVRQQAAEEEVKRLQDSAKVDLDEKFFPPAPAAPGAPAAPVAPRGKG
jgi:peptidyl-prolyl cis-trans isomerase C